MEVEDRLKRKALPLCLTPKLAQPQFDRIRTDTIVGMVVSNLIAICIIYATAATLNATGVTTIQTSSEAAEALRPIAGVFTFAVFAAGIIGTGLLAVPVLAGSAAYALSEAFRWREGLDRRWFQAKSFYGAIAASTMAGVGLNFTSLDPSQGALLERGRQWGARRPGHGGDHAHWRKRPDHGASDIAQADADRWLVGDPGDGSGNDFVLHLLRQANFWSDLSLSGRSVTSPTSERSGREL